MIDKLITMASGIWHDYPDNFSTGMNVSGIGDLFQYVDFVSGQHLGQALLLVFALISFISLKTMGFPASKVLATTSFASFMISVILMLMGLVSFGMVIILLVVAIIITAVIRDEASKGF